MKNMFPKYSIAKVMSVLQGQLQKLDQRLELHEVVLEAARIGQK